VNVRDLKYLVAVSETLHFGRAASRCFVSQPTLSGQIHKLEQELGVTLFERTNRSVNITPVGEHITAYARQVLEQVAAIHTLAQGHKDPLAGPLRVGAIHTLSPYLLPLFLTELRERHPELSLELTEATTDQLLGGLRDHSLDAALLATPPDRDDLEAMALFAEPFWLAHPRDHALYTQDDITLKDLKGLDVLLLSQEHCLSEQVMAACRLTERPDTGPIAGLKASSLETLVQLVGMGLGVTLVPALSVHAGRLATDRVILRQIHIPGATRQVRLVYRASFPRQPALTLFADIIQKVLPNTVKLVALNG
jgi:LysR family hydrogen peroxide-inducible transcriptional activator